jgi:hypothetical protein
VGFHLFPEGECRGKNVCPVPERRRDLRGGVPAFVLSTIFHAFSAFDVETASPRRGELNF